MTASYYFTFLVVYLVFTYYRPWTDPNGGKKIYTKWMLFLTKKGTKRCIPFRLPYAVTFVYLFLGPVSWMQRWPL